VEVTYSVSTGGGENVEVSGIDEVESKGIKRAFALLESVSDLVFLLLLRGSQLA